MSFFYVPTDRHRADRTRRHDRQRDVVGWPLKIALVMTCQMRSNGVTAAQARWMFTDAVKRLQVTIRNYLLAISRLADECARESRTLNGTVAEGVTRSPLVVTAVITVPRPAESHDVGD